MVGCHLPAKKNIATQRRGALDASPTNTVFSFDKRKQANELWTGIVQAGGHEGTDDSLRMRISTSA